MPRKIRIFCFVVPSGPSHAAHAGDGLEGGDTRRPLDAPGGGGTKTSGQLRHGQFGELNNATDAHFGSQSIGAFVAS